MDVVDQINNLASDIISWIPEFIAALAILIVGYLIALALKTIVESTLYKTGINRRLADSPEGNIVKKLTKNPAAFAGQVIYWIVWIWFITLAILALNVSVLNQVIYSIYGYIPEILAALLILIIAIAVASIISSLIMKLIGDTPTGRVTSAIAPSIILTIALFMILVQLGIAWLGRQRSSIKNSRSSLHKGIPKHWTNQKRHGNCEKQRKRRNRKS